MNPHFRLPEHWSAEQADAFLDIIEMLHDAVWRQYGTAMTRLWMCRPPGESFWNDEDDPPEECSAEDHPDDVPQPLP